MKSSKRTLSVITNWPYWQLYVIGILILLGSGILWFARVHMGTEQVFWGMIQNSLSTKGVTIQASQDSEGSNVKQLVQMELGATNRVYSFTNLKQGNTEVQTEIIGTRDADYTRYRGIKTDQKNAAGKPLDVSKIVGVWAKSDDTAQSTTQASGHQLFAQTLLGVGLSIGAVPVPIGEVPAADREDLVRQIKNGNIYDTSFKNVKKERKDGRLQYTYDVKIQTILYVRLMKQFAKDIGLHELDQVDPNSYQSAEPIEVKLTVDALSRQLVGVESPDSGYKQAYRAYGLPLKMEVPKSTITLTEMQERLSKM